MKALKRLEDHKVMHQPDEMKIDPEIILPRSSRPISTASKLLVALLLMACGSTATYLFMKQDRVPAAVSLKTAAVSSQQKRLAVPPVPEVKTEQLQEAIIVVPAVDTRQNKPAVPTKRVPPIMPIEPPLPAPSRAKTVPTLRVNGIAYQNGSADSMAVINGVPVLTGATIEGVTVEEVQKDRVLFQYNGEKFGIPLGQSNR